MKKINDKILDKEDKAAKADTEQLIAKWKEAHKKDNKKAKKPRK